MKLERLIDALFSNVREFDELTISVEKDTNEIKTISIKSFN